MRKRNWNVCLTKENNLEKTLSVPFDNANRSKRRTSVSDWQSKKHFLDNHKRLSSFAMGQGVEQTF